MGSLLRQTCELDHVWFFSTLSAPVLGLFYLSAQNPVEWMDGWDTLLAGVSVEEGWRASIHTCKTDDDDSAISSMSLM